jgi:hypothetical protein
MNNHLIIPDIPKEIIELYVAYNESKNEIIDREYSEICKQDKQTMHAIYCSVIGKIDDDVEEFRQENTLLLDRIDFSDLAVFKSELEQIKCREYKLREIYNYEEVRRVRNDRAKLMSENIAIVDLRIEDFKNQCVSLLDANIYVLNSFITSFINDLSFVINKRLNNQEIKDIIRGKYFLEIEKKIGKMSAISIKRRELEFNLKLLKVIADY